MHFYAPYNVLAFIYALLSATMGGTQQVGIHIWDPTQRPNGLKPITHPRPLLASMAPSVHRQRRNSCYGSVHLTSA